MIKSASMENVCMGCFTQHAAHESPCPMCGYDETVHVPPHHLRPRTILNGKYLLGRVLGEGGFGVTYIGWELNLDLKVAIKEFYPSGFVTREITASGAGSTVQPFTGSQGEFFHKGLSKFINEARTLAKFFSLPGIVSVKDYFQENGTAYIVMEYIEGQTLKEHLAKMGGKLPVAQVFDLMKPVMTSLSEVHKTGLIHRDISPDNIMIGKEGYMKLLDFGAARDFTDSGNKSLSIMLKPGFAPEEQYRTKGVQGPWTDVYALSATIYLCITGVPPEDSVERTRRDELIPPSMLGVAISPSQEAALMTGLAVLQERRYKSMQELHGALYGAAPQQFGPDSAKAAPPPSGPDPKKAAPPPAQPPPAYPPPPAQAPRQNPAPIAGAPKVQAQTPATPPSYPAPPAQGPVQRQAPNAGAPPVQGPIHAQPHAPAQPYPGVPAPPKAKTNLVATWLADYKWTVAISLGLVVVIVAGLLIILTNRTQQPPPDPSPYAPSTSPTRSPTRTEELEQPAPPPTQPEDTPTPVEASIIGVWSMYVSDGIYFELGFNNADEFYQLMYVPGNTYDSQDSSIYVVEGTYRIIGRTIYMEPMWEIDKNLDTGIHDIIQYGMITELQSDYSLSGDAITIIDENGSFAMTKTNPSDTMWDFNERERLASLPPPEPSNLVLAGTFWESFEMSMGGVTLGKEALEREGLTMTLYFIDPYYMEATLDGERADGNYSVNGNSLTMEFNGEYFTAVVEGDILIMEFDDEDGTRIYMKFQEMSER